MSVIIDEVNISYRMLTPHPFNEKVFLALIEEKFEKKAVKGLSISPDGVASVEEFQYLFKGARLNFHQERGVIGVIGTNYPDVNGGFEFLVPVLKDKMNVNLNKVKFLEITARGRYKPKTKPLVRFIDLYNKEILNFFGKFFNEEKEIPMSIRVCSSKALEEETQFREIINWNEFRIEPMLMNPNFYYWDLVFRQENPHKVINLWKEFPKKIEAMLGEFDKTPR